MMSGKHAEMNSQGNAGPGDNYKVEYWKKKLGNSRHILQLPTDKPRSASNANSISVLASEWTQNFAQQINAFAEKIHANVPAVLLATFKVLLYRYSNQDEISLMCLNNEVSSEVDESGKFVPGSPERILLKTKVSGDVPFLEFVKEVHEALLEAGQYQSKLFEELIRSLINEGSDSRSFTQIIFEVGHPETHLAEEVLNSSLADLHLAVSESAGGVMMQWKYNPFLFDKDTIAQVSGHYQNLLSGFIANPGVQISRLDFLSDDETKKLLIDWNDTLRDYPSDKCIQELFEAQVTKTPAAVALELYDPDAGLISSQVLTYHHLNASANQLAHHLRDLGVGPDVLVAVCLSRSSQLVITLLAVLKAGGAYVPMDPSYPTERLQYMLEDSCASVLITEQQLSGIFKDCKQQIIVDTAWDTISLLPDENLVLNVQPENLAYVIYTSGSTGVPKGTMINHRGVVNYLSWCIWNYSVGTGSGAPVNSSIAFDATVTSFFAPLLAGKRVVLLPEKREIEALAEVLMSRQDFSLVKITPAHLEILHHMLPEKERDGQARCFVIGGEALSAGLAKPWRTQASSTRLINEYGPTETVVGCCTYEVGSTAYPGEEVPIGRPIANTQIYILDQYMQPVPIGVSGEIYIGGAGVARGYLNRPDLTRQRFVHNPFSPDPDARLYKTCDLGRYLRDGNIVFQGRIDYQVKIRGYRIELGEIESALLNHSFIQQAAVMARTDYATEKRLVAYVVSHKPQPSSSDLRSYLGKKLPEYMIPSLFVFMESLPLTVNGKIDRSALPPLGQVQTGNFVEPRTDTERTLKKIFEKCLNRHPVGISDDFFEMGGSSVQAAIAFAQIRKALRKSLPLSVLVQAPTIEKLAAYLESNEIKKSQFNFLVPIQPNGNKPPLFCIHGGLGNVLFYRHLSHHLGTDQPVYGLQARGLAGDDTPHTSIEEMAADYIREIRSVQREGPYYLAGYCFGAIVAFEIAQQLVKEGQRIAFMGSFNGIAPPQQQSMQLRSLLRMYKTDSLKSLALYPVLIGKFLLRRYSVMTYYAITQKARHLAYKFYLNRGALVPDPLRRQYVVDAIHKALKNYQPKPYQGQLVVFRSPRIFKNPHLRWTKLINGEIITHDMPGEYRDRKFIMYEPYVVALAKELAKYLGAE